MERKQRTILLVDDDLMNLKILTSVLGTKYNLLVAQGGKKALEMIEVAKLPDLILLDIMMPDLDGYSVCTLLKSEEATKDIPVIFISAMGQDVDEEVGLSLGAVDFIKKPFSLSIVLARVENQLKLANSLKELKELYSKSTIMNRLIKYKNHQIEMILNHSGEGYLMIDPDLVIQSEHSKECYKIFGYEISGKNVLAVFSDFTGFNRIVDEEVFKELFCLSNQELKQKSDVYLELLPDELKKNGEIYHVRYSVIMTEHIGKRLLIVLKNITEKRQLQHRLDVERQKLRMIVNIVSNVENYQALLNNARAFFGKTIFEGIKKGTYKDLLDIYIKTHTYKGVFGQLNIQEVYEVLGKLESLLSLYQDDFSEADSKKLINDVQTLDILNCLEEMNKKVEEFVGFETFSDNCYNSHIIVNRTNLERIKNHIKENPFIHGKDIILSQIEKINFKSLCAVLRKFCLYSKKISSDLGKEKVITEITGEDIFLNPVHYSHLMDSLVHVFRNIVDHGIEQPSERYQKGKNIAGRIHCDVKFEDDVVQLTISDDGKGIDLDDLKSRIKTFRGLTDDEIDELSDEKVMEVLFEERFTSIKDENSFSGGGMGLSALKRALEEIGGTIYIKSEKDKGTKFFIRFKVKGDEYNR